MRCMNGLALLEGRQEPIREKQYYHIGKEEKAAVLRVMESKSLSGFLGRAGERFLGGEYVRRVEDDFEMYFGVKHAVAFNSATTALQAAVAAVGVGPGDEVITSPFTMSATASCILLNNAIPVFADIEPDTYCLDPKSIAERITARTKAILVVNLFGGPANFEPILDIARRYNLRIIEDNAQSPGAKYRGRYTGTIGDIGVFSLNVHKIIHCGEGGILLTGNKEYAFRAQLVRNHGEAVIDDLENQGIWEPVVGSNYRLGELPAAIAAEQLKKLRNLLESRIKNVHYVQERMKEFQWIIPYDEKPHTKNVYYVYPFRFLSERIGITRSTFVKAITAEGFPVQEGYQKPLYLFPLYQRKQSMHYAKGMCPVAERMYENELVFTTIFQPPNGSSEIDAFIKGLKKIEDNSDALRRYEESKKG